MGEKVAKRMCHVVEVTGFDAMNRLKITCLAKADIF
jgi:hypothetical protein